MSQRIKYYAVKVGRKRGIYVSKELAKEQVRGFKGGLLKTCSSFKQAEIFMRKPIVLLEDNRGFYAAVVNRRNIGVHENEFSAREAVKDKPRSYIKKFFTRIEAEKYLANVKETIFYAVKQGKRTGIFLSLEEALEQVQGVCGGEFRKFTDETEAEKYVIQSVLDLPIDENSIHFWTDGSYFTETNKTGYGIVVVQNNRILEKICSRCPSTSSTSTTGELVAVLRVFEIAKARGYSDIVVHHDLNTISTLVNGQAKARKEITIQYVKQYSEYVKNMNCTFIKTEGHSDDEFNIMAHNLAREGASF